VAVPILIFVAAIGVGVVVPERGLQPLSKSPTATIAFWATCGLAGIALALAATHVYEILRQLNNANVGGIGNDRADIVAFGIADTLRDVGTVLGLAAIVYVLARFDRGTSS
jgi:hypothetical protein